MLAMIVKIIPRFLVFSILIDLKSLDHMFKVNNLNYIGNYFKYCCA